MIKRRDVLKFTAALGAATATPAWAQRRRALLIRNARIVSMDLQLGDFIGSIRIANGVIDRIGRDLKPNGEEIIDASGMIAMPGLVDTHCHMWGGLIRGVAGDDAQHGYFPTAARYGAAMSADDIYHSVKLCAAELINAGTTTVNDWCHNVRSREHGLADLRAFTESGLRGRWTMGWMQGQANNQIADLALVEEFRNGWAKLAPARVSMGFGWRGMVRSTPMPREVYRTEFDAARRLGLPISVHAGSAVTAVGEIAALGREEALGPDVQIVHGLSASADELALMKQSGCTLSITPGSELRIGYGIVPIGAFVRSGIPMGIGTDTAALVGELNLFGILKLTRLLENGRSSSEFALGARKVLEMGTIGGAQCLGLDKEIGSLVQGKRADVILIKPDALNIAPAEDVDQLLIETVLPQNVDTVIIDGEILKRKGRLVGIDQTRVIADARKALRALKARADRPN